MRSLTFDSAWLYSELTSKRFFVPVAFVTLSKAHEHDRKLPNHCLDKFRLYQTKFSNISSFTSDYRWNNWLNGAHDFIVFHIKNKLQECSK